MTLTIKGGQVVTPSGVVAGDIRIEGGVISAIGAGLPASSEVVDARGCFVLPGGVDPHCHLLSDVGSASRAAAAGGTTTALSFTLPVDDESPAEALRRAREVVEAGISTIDIGLHAVCYRPDTLTLEDLQLVEELGADAIKIFLAYPELGIMATGASLYRAMVASARVGLPVEVHCEDGELIEALVDEASSGGVHDTALFARVRPPVTEDVSVARAIAVASLANARCYLPHLSSAGALDHIRASRTALSAAVDGPTWSVTAEVCLHNILFDASEYSGPSGEALLVAPPLRERRHVEAIRTALLDGTIDAVGSDHSQHRTPVDARIAASKSSSYGIAGIGARVPLFLSWGWEQGIPIERLAYLLATGPARAFGYAPRKGVLEVGSDGDVLVWDPEERWTVGTESFPDGTGTAPYAGRRVQGAVRFVCLKGRPLVEDGKLLDREPSGGLVVRSR